MGRLTSNIDISTNKRSEFDGSLEEAFDAVWYAV